MAGRQVIEFLRRKWNRELDYRLKKTLWAFTGNRIAVRFEYDVTTTRANGIALTVTRTGSSMNLAT
jgi:nuclear transport factor 2 (NTF2) superfamily protein